MSKKRTADVVGFIQNVSPQKKNKSNCFHFNIQTNSSGHVRKAICFDKDKYQDIKDKKMSTEPVKLVNCVLQDQKGENRFAEIIVNKSSKLEDINPIQVGFSFVEKPITFVNLDAELRVGDLISVKAKLDLSHGAERTVPVGSRNVQVMNGAYLLDKSGSIELTIWDEWISYFKNETPGSIFKLTNLLVKEFNGEVSVTTCADTASTKIVDPSEEADFKDLALLDDSQSIGVKEFESVNAIVHEFICSKCTHGISAIDETSLLKCSNCGTTLRCKNLERTVTFHVAPLLP